MATPLRGAARQRTMGRRSCQPPSCLPWTGTAAGQARWMQTIHLSGAIPLAELPARLVEYMDGWNSAKIKRFCGHGTLWNLSPWKLNWCISKSESERWFHIYSMPRREDESDGHNCIFVPGGETTKLMQPRCFKAKRSQGTHQFMFVVLSSGATLNPCALPSSDSSGMITGHSGILECERRLPASRQDLGLPPQGLPWCWLKSWLGNLVNAKIEGFNCF